MVVLPPRPLEKGEAREPRRTNRKLCKDDIGQVLRLVVVCRLTCRVASRVLRKEGANFLISFPILDYPCMCALPFHSNPLAVGSLRPRTVPRIFLTGLGRPLPSSGLAESSTAIKISVLLLSSNTSP